MAIQDQDGWRWRRKKIGRPPRDLGGAKTKPFTLLLTDAERAAWEICAISNLSDWVRKICNEAASKLDVR